MSIRALRSLISIHRLGSFRAAAEAEHLTPAAISQQMRGLEQAWHIAIFDRSTRTPKLTEAGLALVEEATAVVSAYDTMADKVRSGDQLSGELILGAIPTTLTGLVPLTLSRLNAQHPGIRVRIVPGLSNQLLLQLERGQIHAAIISRPEVLPGNLTLSTIATEDMVLLVSNATEDRSPVDLLRTEPFIRFNRDAVVGRQIEGWLQRQGIAVSDAMELEGLEAISSMVAAGLGVSIVPRRCIAERTTLPLRMISLGKDPPKREIGLVSQANAPRARAIKATAAAALEAVEVGEFMTGA